MPDERLGHRAIVMPRIGAAPGPLPDDVLADYRASTASAVSDRVGCL